MKKPISEERKFAFYAGTVLMVVGLILFFSVFVSAFTHFGTFAPSTGADMKSAMLRGFVGFGMIVVGGFVRGIGARGVAGSGIVLDPEKARGDLEPYSRMAGGMLKDALDEAGIKPSATPEKVVMLKCPHCGKLNEQDSKFCRECGKPL